MAPVTSRLHAWLQLLRLPNLLTVPGDPLAGACLVIVSRGTGRLTDAFPAACAAGLIYAAGLILNDCFDLDVDRRNRPNRPLPTGRIKRSTAAMAGAVLLTGGTGIAFIANPVTGLTAIGLAAMVILYNGPLKRSGPVGALAMGLCRGLSFLLGVTATAGTAAAPLPLAAASFLTLYIAAVTLVARHEHEQRDLEGRRWLPALTLLPLLGTAVAGAHVAALVSGLAALTAVVVALRLGMDLRGSPEPETVQRVVGCFIRLLLLVQATYCFLQWPGGAAIAVALLLLWPLNARLNRWFYAS